MELPESLTCTSLMTDFLSEGRRALNLLSEQQQLGLSRLGMSLSKIIQGGRGQKEEGGARASLKNISVGIVVTSRVVGTFIMLSCRLAAHMIIPCVSVQCRMPTLCSRNQKNTGFHKKSML